MKDHPADRTEEVHLAELVMPNHTNHHGNLFGGHALGLMDHAGWVAATRCARLNMVTVASDRVEFKVPVRAGQLVELVAKVTRIGRTSVIQGDGTRQAPSPTPITGSVSRSARASGASAT